MSGAIVGKTQDSWHQDGCNLGDIIEDAEDYRNTDIMQISRTKVAFQTIVLAKRDGRLDYSEVP